MYFLQQKKIVNYNKKDNSLIKIIFGSGKYWEISMSLVGSEEMEGGRGEL